MRDQYEARDTTNRMRLAATAFLESLRADQRPLAMLSCETTSTTRSAGPST
jgi:hypothetical protein